MKRLLLIASAVILGWLWPALLWAKTNYLTQAGGGGSPNTGVDIAHAFSAADFNTSGASFWGAGAGKISPGDTVVRVGAFTSQLIVQASGTSATLTGRTTITGDSTNPGAGAALNGTDSGPGIDFNGKNNIAAVSGIYTQPVNPTTYAVFSINTASSSGLLIEDNYVHDTYSQGVRDRTSWKLTSSIIRHNTFSNIFGTGGGASTNGFTVIDVSYGDTNLIEYNIILKSLDRAQTYVGPTIVRNNYWGATDTFLYPNTAGGGPYPWHTDGWSNFGTTGVAVSKFLYERNYDTDNSDSVGSGSPLSPNGHSFIFQNGTTGTITQVVRRFNVSVRQAETDAILAGLTSYYDYNNTCVAVAIVYPTFGGRSSIGKGASTNNYVTFQNNGAGSNNDKFHFLNDTWDFSPPSVVGTNQGGVISDYSNIPTNSTYDRLHAYNQTGTQPVFSATFSATNTLTATTPGFVSDAYFGATVGQDDYTLTAGSLLRAAGRVPTTVAAGDSGSGTTLIVNNAFWFCDGWGIADADWIKVGSNAYQQIVSINYGTNTITLTSGISRGPGDSVIAKGQEDVGAMPYNYTAPSQTITVTNTTATASPTTFNATTTTADSVRSVEGWFAPNSTGVWLPVGLVYYSGTNSYSGAYTPGVAGTLKVRAYNLWAANASSKLIAESSLLVNQDPTSFAHGTVTVSSVPYTFTDGSAGVDSTEIAYSTDAVNYTVFATLSPSVTSGTVTGLSASTAYTFRARAVNASGVFGGPVTMTATTNSSTPLAVQIMRNPAALGVGNN